MDNSTKPGAGNVQLPETGQDDGLSPTAHLILVLYGNELAAWQILPGGEPRSLLVKGDERLSICDALALKSAQADIADRLRGDGVTIGCTHWLVDGRGRELFTNYASMANEAAAWQLLAWEWLAERFGLGGATPWTSGDSFTGQVLPWLVSSDDAALRRQLQQARASEHNGEIERLAAERVSLIQENERLRAQNTAMQQMETEPLVRFLPALYPRVFTVIGPTDLALLCGWVKQLSIPNPYPEPSEETLRTLQKRFRALPHAQQQQIVRFVAELPQRQKLQPRAEMRDLVHELEGD